MNPIAWRPILVCILGGWGIQVAWWILATRRWFVRLVFPGAEGWGLWAASLGLFYAFIFGVLPIACLGVLVVTYRWAPQRKWTHALIATAVTLLPLTLLVLLHFCGVDYRLAAP